MTDKTAARIAFLAALTVFGFALVPVAFGDKGGNPNGGANGGNASVTTTASTSTTSSSTPTSSTTTTSPTKTTATTTSTGNGKGNGKGGGGGGSGSPPSTPSTSLTLVSEWTSSSRNLSAPTWCLNEDDYDQRNFSGSLSGSFTTAYQLCDVNTDYSGGLWWSAGGLGLETDLSVVGALTDLTITAPDGTTRSAVLTGENVTNGKTAYQYAACFAPPYSISTNEGTDPLQGGTWMITLSGQITQANWTTRVQMADVPFQDAYCPASEQNLTP